MEDPNVSKYLSKIGRRGAQERAKRLSAEQRNEIAPKAGKASGKVRRKKRKNKAQVVVRDCAGSMRERGTNPAENQSAKLNVF